MSWRAGGVRNWVVQRVSALYMALFIVMATAFMAGAGNLDYGRWMTLLGSPVFNVLLLMFFTALLLHAWVGVRDVLLDYLSHDGVRFTALVFFALYLLFMAVWVFRLLFIPLRLS